MSLKVKTIYRSLAGIEIALLIMCLLMIKAADMLRGENGIFYFLMIIGICVIVPLSLVFLCETARYFLRKEFEND